MSLHGKQNVWKIDLDRVDWPTKSGNPTLDQVRGLGRDDPEGVCYVEFRIVLEDHLDGDLAGQHPGLSVDDRVPNVFFAPDKYDGPVLVRV